MARRRNLVLRKKEKNCQLVGFAIPLDYREKQETNTWILLEAKNAVERGW